MFYKMIQKARDRWFNSDECTIREILHYILLRGKLRDAQIDAIKTYLFLKVKCRAKPLADLFSEGYFTNINADDLELKTKTRDFLHENPAALALLEYSRSIDDNGNQISKKLANMIKETPEVIDYKRVFKDIFYKNDYSDYLFSLPMGAGKTYLMAMFIYLDLYFAMNEPLNPAFAHNFIILAPSGLKSSVIPSLRTIQNFDPTWIIPDPAASEIKRMMSFEVLDANKSENKSNKAKNPNVQKIANHQPLKDVMGLVLVTNAEKVILNRVKLEKGQVSLFEDSDDEKDRKANELRNLIGKIPYLSVFIDEVHHAVNDEIKLRAVAAHWAEGKTFNSVIGFSGTPYLEKPEKFDIAEKLKLSSSEITTIVNYYPLIRGIGNFLKKPIVKIEDEPDSTLIVESGVNYFLSSYKNKIYKNGTTAKLGIYCGTIEKLEEVIYPLVSRIVEKYGLPQDCILKFHKGNKQYPQPADSQMQFDILDKDISKIRIILLVQICKEGWDCRSLTGIILSQEGDCPQNMVLQTSCRCLREEDHAADETAMIYLNDYNAKKLEVQLKEQHHISLEEFRNGARQETTIKRYNRMKHLKLPPVKFYQLKVEFKEHTIKKANVRASLQNIANETSVKSHFLRTTDFTWKENHGSSDSVYAAEKGQTPATFHSWIYHLYKSSFRLISLKDFNAYEKELRVIYGKITFSESGKPDIYTSRIDIPKVEEEIRKAFADERVVTTKEELIPETASLLNIANFTPEVKVTTDAAGEYYPDQKTVEGIHRIDTGKAKIPEKYAFLIKQLEADHMDQTLDSLRKKFLPDVGPNIDRSYHYMPYHMDSALEKEFLDEMLPASVIKDKNLEIYYNGDGSLTEFRIKCYRKTADGVGDYIGKYTPDFLIIQRKDRKIYKALIVETKGQAYANDPHFIDRKTFMEKIFVPHNNEEFGYKKFDYLYLEDSARINDRRVAAIEKIKEFFD